MHQGFQPSPLAPQNIDRSATGVRSLGVGLIEPRLLLPNCHPLSLLGFGAGGVPFNGDPADVPEPRGGIAMGSRPLHDRYGYPDIQQVAVHIEVTV